MLPDRVSNPGPLTYESGALPIALRGPAQPSSKWIQPSSKWIPCSNQGRIGQRKERDGLRPSSACPKYSGSLPLQV